MNDGATYRAVAIMKDGSRQVLGEGLTKSAAEAILRISIAEQTKFSVIIELEGRPVEATDEPTASRPKE